MQRLTREMFQRIDHGRAGSRRDTETPAVGRIAHQWIVDVRHVYANLVGTAGFQLDPHMGVGTETFKHTVMTHRLLTAFHDRHALTLLAVTPDRRVDLATGSDDTDHDALVDTADTAALQLGNQLGLRLDGLGNHHQTGGVLVQAVHDTGARHIDDVRHVMQQSVEQRAIGVACCGVNHQTGRFVDHQNLIVLVDDIKLNILRQPFTLGFLLGNKIQNGAAMHDVTRTQNSAIHSQAAVFDPGGKARARVLSE